MRECVRLKYGMEPRCAERVVCPQTAPFDRGSVRIATVQRLQQVLRQGNDCAAADCLIDGLVAATATHAHLRTFPRHRAAAKAK
jgi:hypothetical protein